MRRERYKSLLKVTGDDVTTRAWHMTSSGDEFVAKPLNISRQIETNHPYLQEDLMEISTPALVMFENFHGVFLWEHLSSEPLTASAKRHYDVIKRLAMETCLNYVRGNLHLSRRSS